MSHHIPAPQGDAYDWNQPGEAAAEEFRLLGAILLAQAGTGLSAEEPAEESADDPGQHAKHRRSEEEGGVSGEHCRRQAHGKQSANGADDGSGQSTEIVLT